MNITTLIAEGITEERIARKLMAVYNPVDKYRKPVDKTIKIEENVKKSRKLLKKNRT